MTPVQLAEGAGTSLDAIGALDREVNVPTIETSAKLIKALGINAGAVFDAKSEARRVSAARRDVEAEVQEILESLDDHGAGLLLELAKAVAAVQPAKTTSSRVRD